jgi:intracellular septation protein
MDANISLPPAMWTRLNMSWTGFFIFLGVANLYVVYNFDTDTWVNFKLFGMMGLTFAFVVIQGLILMKHIDQQTDTKE